MPKLPQVNLSNMKRSELLELSRKLWVKYSWGFIFSYKATTISSGLGIVYYLGHGSDNYVMNYYLCMFQIWFILLVNNVLIFTLKYRVEFSIFLDTNNKFRFFGKLWILLIIYINFCVVSQHIDDSLEWFWQPNLSFSRGAIKFCFLSNELLSCWKLLLLLRWINESFLTAGLEWYRNILFININSLT